jgi:hypothetical protein
MIIILKLNNNKNLLNLLLKFNSKNEYHELAEDHPPLERMVSSLQLRHEAIKAPLQLDG